MCLVRPMRALAFVAVTIVFLNGVTRGDTPLSPPTKHTVNSPKGAIRAVSDPDSGTNVESVKRSEVLWRLPGWYRSLFVADDGKHLVTEYDGLNLLPTDFRDDLVLLTFWREGKKIREITAFFNAPPRIMRGAGTSASTRKAG